MPSHARVIPSIEQLRQREAVQRLEARYGREATLAAIRHETAALRERLTGGSGGASHDEPADGATGQATGGSAGWAHDAPTDPEAAAAVILARLEPRLRAAVAPSLRSVVNATGVIVHTNLGRAPLAGAALERIAEVAAGYANLEYDVAAGTRGSRTVHAATLLTQLTGAEAAVVVNNNAAAVLLVLAALADGREVIISRGELVEIGGGFRIPDVMRQSGAILREVGTTNRTRAADYAAAIGERTALMLRVHPSNFRIEGFTERPALAEVAALGARFDIPVVEDLGSGQLSVGAAAGAVGGRAGAGAIGDEPTVDASIDAGVSVCTFSGDKLLGGPQAGIIVGRRALLERVRRHPLMRALRVDKLTIAALEATLIEHAAGRADQTVPVARMIAAPVKELAARAEALRARLDGGGRSARRRHCQSARRRHCRSARRRHCRSARRRHCRSARLRPSRPARRRSAAAAPRGLPSKAVHSPSPWPAGRPTTWPPPSAPMIRQSSAASPTTPSGWTSAPSRPNRTTPWPPP